MLIRAIFFRHVSRAYFATLLPRRQDTLLLLPFFICHFAIYYRAETTAVDAIDFRYCHELMLTFCRAMLDFSRR